ncbi:MAG: twin-arginine translocase subunit TatC [Bdellovibrionales bacterium]
MNPEDSNMTLVQHLTDLRYRLVKAVQGIAVGVAVCIYYSENLFVLIRKPILPYLGENGGLVFTGVMDKFIAHLKVGALGGLILTCPYWLYHVWQFISPGLYKKERRYAVGFIFTGTMLFLAGVCFVYFFVYPTAFKYLLEFGGQIDKPMITIGEYLGFFALTTIMFGVSFELPVVLVILAMMGVIDASFLKRNRRIAIVILAFVSALLTPPDVISMVMMLVPMYFLYEVSIWVIQAIVTKRDRSIIGVPD